jgi:hypothetical protein
MSESMMATMKPMIPPSEYDEARIIERPDGFYRESSEGGRDSGPFPTRLEAVQDMEVEDEESPEPGETLEEAESELGMADWIDPDTGEPAEEQRARIEEH